MPTLIYLLCLAGGASPPPDESNFHVNHIDELRANASLTLNDVIAHTAERYPTMALLRAKAEEAVAYHEFADTPFAGEHIGHVGYSDDRPVDNNGQRLFDAGLSVQMWRWGEHSAVERIADAADADHAVYQKFIRYTVAELVRESLWRISLSLFEFENAKKINDLAQDLLESVKIRVAAGDLAQADLLLARSEYLDSKAEVIRAEAELMHSRRAYISITGLDEMPGNFEEIQSPLDVINMNHIAIRSINAVIEKEKARITYLRFQSNSQLLVSVGFTRQHSSFGSTPQNSLGLTVDVPFGAPQRLNALAASQNVVVNETIAQRETLMRSLQLRLHEAEHNIQVGRVNLELAESRADLAEKYIATQEFGFKNGEVSLSDLLIARKRAFQAIRSLEQQQIALKRDIAVYNQVVGVLP
ncbi:MAG: TolC family protein [Methylococcales bacterium]